MEKKRAILVTGFSNWGKSTVIYSLFGKKRIFKQKTYEIPSLSVNKRFIVMPYSNDDIASSGKFLLELRNRYSNAGNDVDLLSAFCPTSKGNNNSREILEDNFFEQFNEIIMIYLVDRWDNHASLNITIIKKFYMGIEKLQHAEIVDYDNLTLKINSIKKILENIYMNS